MSLSSILKTIGKDLKDVGGWIDDGLKAVDSVLNVVDPPLGAIFSAVDAALESILKINGTKLTASEVQAIVTAVSTLESLKSAAPPTSS